VKAEALGLSIHPGWEEFEITNEIFSKKIEPTLIQPTFVTHLPKELCPLAKLNPDDPTVLDVFELTIGGMEVAPAYSEQNDPDAQRAMFEAQAGEEKQNIDYDFLLALEHGNAAGRRHGRGHRSPLHSAHGRGEHPRCDPVPAVAGREREAKKKVERQKEETRKHGFVSSFSISPVSSLPAMPWYLYLALKQLFPTGGSFRSSRRSRCWACRSAVAVLIISSSVMGGFGDQIKKMTVDTQGDVQIRGDWSDH